MDIQRIQAVLEGVMFGDALGMPWETMSREEIAEHHPEGIVFFADPVQRCLQDAENLAAGDVTDDWELTQAVADALIWQGGFSQESQAESLIKAFNKPNRIGWGGSTERAAQSFKDGRAASTPATDLGAGMGGGNGVAIKVAPLAIWYALQGDSDTELYESVQQLGAMTHSKAEASDLAWVLAKCIQGALQDQSSPTNMIRHCRDILAASEGHDVSVGQLNTLLTTTCLDQVYVSIGCGFSAKASVPFALGAWMYADDHRPVSSLLDCISYGGDCDSTGSMCGALLGAQHGISAWPEQWRTFREHFCEAQHSAYNLHKAALIA